MRIFALLLLFVSCAFSQVIDFSVKFIYPKPDRDLILKLNAFTTELERQLENYDWKFPHKDFEKIETNININIEKLVSDKNFAGVITVSSGLVTEAKTPIVLKKDVYFSEQDMSFGIAYEEDPDISILNSTSVESVIMFYSNLALGEVFDRLSYTDQKNFRLEGDQYFQKLYEFENILLSAGDRNAWNKRIEIINNYRLNKNIEERKINAYLYNAVWFYNNGKKERAVHFIEPIIDSMSKSSGLSDIFFMNNFFALGEIFALSGDPKHLDFLIMKDPSHENYYSGKKPKERNPGKPKSE